MSERVAIVTGAGGELGRAAARRVLDLELRPLGIRLNAVAPQLLDTAETRQFLSADVLAHAVAPEAIAAVTAYLASDTAAPVSGAVVPAYGS
jgi:NAD(P)-dependent dehydrogenase (short-subunit alcohol dehydrogenase family)